MQSKLIPVIFSFVLLWLNSFNVLAQNGIKVACVGNSITEGAKLDKTYPEVLQDLMGEDYNVRNFGLSGRTLLKKGNLPYWDEKIYQEVLAWNPDVVIIKLGTNDTKPQNWQFKDEFVKDYLALIKTFKNLPSEPEIFICYPIPVFEENWGINEVAVKEKVIPAVKKVARKAKVKTIDLYTPFLGKSHFTYDGIHPNEEGAALLASEIYKALKSAKAVSVK